MNFGGQFSVNVPREKVWGFLIDPKKFSDCIPDLQSLEILEDKVRANVKTALTAISGNITFEFTYVEKNAPTHAKIEGTGKGLKSIFRFKGILDLEESAPGATAVNWKTEIEPVGLVAQLGQRVLAPAIENTAQKIMTNLKQKLEHDSKRI
jgi:carbon monoxide dehydrogenase subunit G